MCICVWLHKGLVADNRSVIGLVLSIEWVQAGKPGVWTGNPAVWTGEPAVWTGNPAVCVCEHQGSGLIAGPTGERYAPPLRC